MRADSTDGRPPPGLFADEAVRKRAADGRRLHDRGCRFRLFASPPRRRRSFRSSRNRSGPGLTPKARINASQGPGRLAERSPRINADRPLAGRKSGATGRAFGQAVPEGNRLSDKTANWRNFRPKWLSMRQLAHPRRLPILKRFKIGYGAVLKAAHLQTFEDSSAAPTPYPGLDLAISPDSPPTLTPEPVPHLGISPDSLPPEPYL